MEDNVPKDRCWFQSAPVTEVVYETKEEISAFSDAFRFTGVEKIDRKPAKHRLVWRNFVIEEELRLEEWDSVNQRWLTFKDKDPREVEILQMMLIEAANG